MSSSEIMIAGMLHYWRRSSRPWTLQNVLPYIKTCCFSFPSSHKSSCWWTGL